MSFIDLGGMPGARLWRGDPDCQAAHDELLTHLKARNSQFLPACEALGSRRLGNFGEHIAFRIGFANDYSGWRPRTINALNPFSNNSTSGVDIIWLLLSATTPANDLVAIQEMKTTPASDLGIAYELTHDYKKLFGLNLDFTLQTRLQCLANELEVVPGFNPAELHRIIALGQATPALSSQVRLVPTLVHDLGANDPRPLLLAVRTSITKLGWATQHITPWSVAMTDLLARLERLSHGKP
jgi:hypothetical protein